MSIRSIATRRPPAALRLVLALTVAMTAACAHVRPATETGFLGSDYSALAAAQGRQVWGVPDEVRLEITETLRRRIEAGDIREVHVARAVYRPVDNPRYRPDAAAASRLAGYATRKFAEALAGHFTLVDEPSAGSVTVRLALTDMMNSNVWVNTVATILLVPVDLGAVSGELEVVDSVTGERLLAMTATRGGSFFHILEAFNRHGHVRHGIKKWAKLTRQLLSGAC